MRNILTIALAFVLGFLARRIPFLAVNAPTNGHQTQPTAPQIPNPTPAQPAGHTHVAVAPIRPIHIHVVNIVPQPAPVPATQPIPVHPAHAQYPHPWIGLGILACTTALILFLGVWYLTDPQRDLDAVKDMAGPTLSTHELTRVISDQNGVRDVYVEYVYNSLYHPLADATERAQFQVGSDFEVETDTAMGQRVYTHGEKFKSNHVVARRVGLLRSIQDLLKR